MLIGQAIATVPDITTDAKNTRLAAFQKRGK